MPEKASSKSELQRIIVRINIEALDVAELPAILTRLREALAGVQGVTTETAILSPLPQRI